MTQETGHQSTADPLLPAFAADSHGSRHTVDGRGAPGAHEAETEAALADQRAHIAMLTERHTFLTDREAELRQFLASVHAQLLTRDTDRHKLLTLLERIVDEQSRRIEVLTAENESLAAQARERMRQIDLLTEARAAYVAETERYVAGLERSWNEKNAHIAMLEAMVRPARRGRLARTIGRARSVVARW